jgi:hypothetical protein
MKLKEAGTRRKSAVAEVSLVELSANGVTLAWPEAVALISQICRCLIASGTQGIDPSTIVIQSTGDVIVRGATSLEAERSVHLLGALLRTYLAGTSHPVPLQMLIAQATCTPPFYRSIAELAEALSHYSSSNLQELTRSVYERWRNDHPVPVRAALPVGTVFRWVAIACLRKFLAHCGDAWTLISKLRHLQAARPPWMTQRVVSITAAILFCIAVAGFSFASGFDRSAAPAIVAQIGRANAHASAALTSTVGGAVELVRSRFRRTPSTVANSAVGSPASKPRPTRISMQAASPAPAAIRTPAEQSGVADIEDERTSHSSGPALELVAPPLAALPSRQLAANAPAPRHLPDQLDPDELRVYSAQDTDVIPPVAIDRMRPDEPPLNRQDAAAITIVVGEDGRVESATLARRPGTFKETVAATMNLSAVKAWRFHPALQTGRPVKYRTTVWVVNR